MVNDVILTRNEGNNQKSGKLVGAVNKIKVERDYNSPVNKPRFASPFYVQIHKIGNERCMIQIHFVEQYDISVQGLSPKHVKVPKDIVEKDIFKLFEPLANKNGYNYVHIDYPNRKNGIFMDNNTPKALCSNIKVDFNGHGERIGM